MERFKYSIQFLSFLIKTNGMNSCVKIPMLKERHLVIIQNEWFEDYHKREEKYTSTIIQIQTDSWTEYSLLDAIIRNSGAKSFSEDTGYQPIMSDRQAKVSCNNYYRDVKTDIIDVLFEKIPDTSPHIISYNNTR